ncbi:MAG: hypothetical protein K6F22_05705 [Prevotella sp.]|nr:hypothetical protein [Prevotella sp.]
MFQNIVDVECPINDPEYVPSQSDLDNILREIFTVDERTGMPMQDIGYFLSKDGNPFVKDWLENNLLRPRAARGGVDPSLIGDDLIVECSRRKDESAFDYASRLNDIYNEATAELEKQKNSKSD